MTEKRKAIGVHHTEIDEGSWDGPGNVARLKTGENESYYRRMFAWMDAEADPETKAAYKFPHHVVSGDGEIGAANVKGAQSGIGVLNGAMGGANIPDDDRRGIYSHLAAHLRDADVEPAELSSSGVEIERRTVMVTELRVVGDMQSPKITGYAAVFDTLSEELWGFFERINPGAFSKTLKESDIRALFNHDPNYVLGRTSAGTLSLNEDDKGLAFEIDPPDTQWSRDLVVSMKRGDINQMSFGFRTIRDEWISAQEKVIRTLVEVQLFDVSPVTFPAYPQTSAQVRSKVLELQAYREEHDSPPVEPPGEGAGAPGTEAHSSAGQQGAQERLRMLHRKLDLAEKEF